VVESSLLQAQASAIMAANAKMFFFISLLSKEILP
jgi:hypothetical protein